MVRARAPPLGRVVDGRGDRSPYAPDLSLWRVQKAARSDVDGRGGAVPRGDDLRVYRLFAALGSNRLLGDSDRHQHGRHGSAHRRFSLPGLARRRNPRRIDAVTVLCDSCVVSSGHPDRRDRAASVRVETGRSGRTLDRRSRVAGQRDLRSPAGLYGCGGDCPGVSHGRRAGLEHSSAPDG